MTTRQNSPTDMPVRDDSGAIDKVHDLIATSRFAMFGTYDAEGTCHSRPMAAVKQDRNQDDEGLWFFTRSDSRKVAEIDADARVTVDYIDPSDNNFICITGRAVVVRDRGKIEELWKEPIRTWLPEGTEDDHIALIRVSMETAEYWDSPSSAMVFAYGYAKSRLTGQPPELGETAQVKL